MRRQCHHANRGDVALQASTTWAARCAGSPGRSSASSPGAPTRGTDSRSPHVVAADTGVGHALLEANKAGKLYRVAYEEDGRIVADGSLPHEKDASASARNGPRLSDSDIDRTALYRFQSRPRQDWMKASRSLMIVSASVVGMPCGNPGYAFRDPFRSSIADSSTTAT